MTRKHFVTRRMVVFAAAATLGITLGAAPAATAAERTIRFGHVWPLDQGWGGAAQRFADLVNQQAKGKIEIKVFPSGQLGNEREVFEGLQLGNVDMSFGGPGVLSNFDPTIGVFDLPFLFRDYAHANQVMDGEIGQKVWDSVRTKARIRVLASGAQGFRYVLTRNRPIKGIEDLKGVKLRVPETETFLRTFRLVGASPVGMAWGETYNAINNGVIDGMEGVPEFILTQKVYEVGKHIARTGHIMATLQILVSESTFQSLDPEIQEIIKSAARTVWHEQRAAAEIGNKHAEAELAKRGSTFTNVDTAPLRAAVIPFWQDWGKRTGMDQLVEDINRL